MKILTILIALLPLVSFANEKPEKIYPITRVMKTAEYYTSQAKLWEAETKRQPDNEDAWFNYYMAARNTNIVGEKTYELTPIVEACAAAVPNTFTANFLTFKNANGDPELFEHLERASKIRPDDPMIFPAFINYYKRKGDEAKVKEFSQKWIDSGAYATSILTWNYNVLIGLEPNAIIITHGDNDTYPLWLLQNTQGIRQDVTVININLCNYPDYRDNSLQKTGIAPYREEMGDNYLSDLTQHIIANAKQPVYLGIAISKQVRDHFNADLYIVGLAFKHAKSKFDNVAVLRNNYENKFLTDYLKIGWTNDISYPVVNQMNLNYLPAFLMLHEHYASAGQEQKATKLKSLSLDIAEKGGRKEQIQAHFNKNNTTPTKTLHSQISIKELEKSMKPIKGNLYAAETELTNASYEAFLRDLLDNREFDKLQLSKIHDTNWRALLPSEYQDYPAELLFEHGHPDDLGVPVKNISYAAAMLYCEWITEVYNNSDYPKKKYAKVRFRLPTAEEWELAARGGIENMNYPWGGQYYKNDKGCYLANFNTFQEPPCEDCPGSSLFKTMEGGKEVLIPKSQDGGFFMVNADAYFPNNLGLFNTSGNMAEMVAEEGRAKGGSWLDKPADCTVKAERLFTGPDPAVGFRVFMEVLE